MALPVTSLATETDTIAGEVVEFSIGDPKWVMRALADLYSDITLALIREYSTNAIDAEIELAESQGTEPKPVEVSLPTILDPTFTVRDHGIGMSLETLKHQYTSFGDSGSRNSAKKNGMLGFGCKAAAAYTDSFTVTSVKDGIETVAVIDRHPDWSITLKVVRVAETSEPNGTTVEIQIANVAEFNQKAHDFYKFLRPGTVLVDGAEPSQAVGEKITDNLYYTEGTFNSYVVMGNVPYRVANPHALFVGTGLNPINFIAYVDNGAVEFSNSREDLKYTEVTKNTLSGLITDFADKIVKQAQDEIDNAKDHFDAFLVWSNWCNRLGRGAFQQLTYNGVDLENTFKVHGRKWNTTMDRYMMQRVDEWQVQFVKNTHFVTGFTADVSSGSRRKMKDWFALKGLALPNNVIFVREDKIDSIWVPASKVVSWEQVRKDVPRKKASGPSVGGRVPGSWDYITRDGRVFESTVPAGKTYYISLQSEKHTNVQTLLNMVDSKAAVVIVPANRLPKFTRDNPMVKSFNKFISSKIETDMTKFLSEDAKIVKSLTSTTLNWLERLDLSRVSDPRFDRYQRLYAKKKELLAEYEKHVRIARMARVAYNDYNGSSLDLMADYPLLDHISSWYLLNNSELMDEVYLYMNSKHAELEKKNA